MNILLVVGVWLLLGVIFCLVSGRGIADAQAPAREPADQPAAPPATSSEVAPRQFTTLAVHEWALAAHDIGLDELLSTRPGAIRRVAAT